MTTETKDKTTTTIMLTSRDIKSCIACACGRLILLGTQTVAHMYRGRCAACGQKYEVRGI